MPGSSRWSLSLMFLHQNSVLTYPHSLMHYMPSPSHFSWLYHPNYIWWGVHIIKLLIM
jgi:hypothetical protein